MYEFNANEYREELKAKLENLLSKENKKYLEKYHLINKLLDAVFIPGLINIDITDVRIVLGNMNIVFYVDEIISKKETFKLKEVTANKGLFIFSIGKNIVTSDLEKQLESMRRINKNLDIIVGINQDNALKEDEIKGFGIFTK